MTGREFVRMFPDVPWELDSPITCCRDMCREMATHKMNFGIVRREFMPRHGALFNVMEWSFACDEHAREHNERSERNAKTQGAIRKAFGERRRREIRELRRTARRIARRYRNEMR